MYRASQLDLRQDPRRPDRSAGAPVVVFDRSLVEAPPVAAAPPAVIVAAEPVEPPPAAEPSALAGLSQRFPGFGRLDRIGLDLLLRWLGAGVKWMGIGLILGLAAAALYAMTASPRYQVFTDLIVDPASLNVVTNDVFTVSPQRDAQLLEVESKLRVLTSRNVLARVVDKLDLVHDREFADPGAIGRLKAFFFPKTVDADGARLAALRALDERVVAKREERSFVVALGVWAASPPKAIALSDAIVAAFQAELSQSDAESAGRLAQNLKDRLDALRADVTEAERKVEDFRRAHGLRSTNGELASNQQTNEINTQVLDAQQRLIEAESRYRQIEDALASRRPAGAPALDSPTMTSLRDQYDALQQQISALGLTYGPRHPRLVTARSESDALETAMTREARRLAEVAASDLAKQRATVDKLTAKASDKSATVFADYDAQVMLRDLERDASVKAGMYQTYLTRAREVAERQGIDATNVRVISPAMPPQAPIWPPRTLILLALGGIGGLAVGMALALLFGLWSFLRRPGPAR
jgi:uncharacterized protein involved in exopolysaccharide biosynthesis